MAQSMMAGLLRLNNNINFNGWNKYSVPYPVRGYEVHYSVDELTCQYADVKTKNLWSK